MAAKRCGDGDNSETKRHKLDSVSSGTEEEDVLHRDGIQRSKTLPYTHCQSVIEGDGLVYRQRADARGAFDEDNKDTRLLSVRDEQILRVKSCSLQPPMDCSTSAIGQQ